MYEIDSVKPAGPSRRTGTAAAGKLYALHPSPGPLSPFLVRERSGSYRTFHDDLREFISLRLDRVNPYRESREYGEQWESASRLYEELRGMLPEEGRSLLPQYAEALGAANGLEVEMLAEKAFLDGVRILIRALTGSHAS